MRNALYSLVALAWVVTVTVPGSETANHTAIEQTCSVSSPGMIDVGVNWPAAPGAGEIWIDISPYSVGLDAGAFVSQGPFSPATASYTLTGLQPGTRFYYRVNALYKDGWRSLKTGSFVTGHCSDAPPLNFSVLQHCSGNFLGTVSVDFSWSPDLGPEGPQWLDVSLYNTNFSPGSFVSKGPLDSSQSSLSWDGFNSGAIYYWRVNTQGSDGWHPGETRTFATIGCSIQPNPDMLQLQQRLAETIANSGYNIAVAVTDLQTGESVDVKGDDIRYAGCTLNWFVLLSNVLDVQNGTTPEGEVGGLIAATIWGSNPFTAHDLLLKTSGTGKVEDGVYKLNELIGKLGLHSTVFDHPPGYEGDALEYSLKGSLNQITANDAAHALTQFYYGSVVNAEWRDYLLQKMTGVKSGLQYLIGRSAPDGVASHKNGFSWMPSGWVDNDIGIIRFNTASGPHAYAVAIYIQDFPVEYADIPTGQTVLHLIWDYFSNHYQ